MIGWDGEVEVFYVLRPDCKCWNCPSCAARLRARWSLRTFLGVSEYQRQGEHFKFVTVTSHERLYGISQTLKVWPPAWAKLRSRVGYEVGKWRFVLVPEQHQDGRLHVHIIASTDLGTRWWKDNARECGLGYIAEEAEFKQADGHPARAAAYVSKYLGKQQGVAVWPRYFHHIRTSQHFPELPPLGDNPYDGIAWIALSPKQIINWLALREHENQPVYYTGTGELVS